MMLKLVVLAILFTGSYASVIRIVNGTDAEDGEFSFAVSLRKYGRHTCGATILNENFVLTAAHCACNATVPLDAQDYSIQYGLTDITTTDVNIIAIKTISCNQFDPDKLIFDSAVLELSQSLPQNDSWTPVQLSREFNTSVPQKGEIIGWGRLSQDGPLPSRLQKLTVDIYDDDVCGVEFDNEQHVCFGAGNAGACNGDSGTALLVDRVQVGIASFITADCGLSNEEFPNVYSRVATYFEWIASIAGELS